MKITAVRVWALDLPLSAGSYSWNTQSFPSFPTTIVAVDTDAGLTGYGEMTALGPAYMPSFSEGARAGLKVLAPAVLGHDPTRVRPMTHRMDNALKGHPYAKSALDMACWDLWGKATDQPVANLLGGSFRDEVKLFRVISRDEPAAMVDSLLQARASGYCQFQMKVGEHPDRDIERMIAVAAALDPGEVLAADANTGWRQHEALRVMDAVRDLPVYIEQPCLTLAECEAVRRRTDHPIILDEVMDSTAAIRAGAAAGAMDLINLKISRFGGLTGAHDAMRLCVDLGVTMTIEDTWGSEIATAAIAHLAAATPPGFHFQSSAFHSYNDVVTATGGPVVANGHMTVPNGPGLGVEPDLELLGAPVFHA